MRRKPVSPIVKFLILKFPRIYRFITDLPAIAMLKHLQAGKNLKKALKLQTLVFIFALLGTLILITAFDLISNVQKDKEQTFQRKVLTSQLNTWESISQKFPNFKEAYYQMAVLSYRLGDFEKAKIYLNKSLFLDPNSQKAKELQRKLY